MYGKGWKKIASLIKTRTVVQIRTHAQKYFLKLTKARQSGDANVSNDGKTAGTGGRKVLHRTCFSSLLVSPLCISLTALLCSALFCFTSYFMSSYTLPLCLTCLAMLCVRKRGVPWIALLPLLRLCCPLWSSTTTDQVTWHDMRLISTHLFYSPSLTIFSVFFFASLLYVAW